MPAYLSPVGNESQVDTNGAPLTGGKVYSYLAGTSTPTPTYTDSTGVTPQTNPIILNSRGLPASPIWLGAGVAVKLVFTDSNDVLIRTVDNVLGVGDPANTTAQDQWVTYSGTPSYISATSFSLPGDQTGTFHANRRIKTTNAGGTIYSTISNAAFGAGITTLTVVNDSGTLDASLSAVSYGIISYTDTSQPKHLGELLNIQTFTVTGVYTPTLGTTSVVVEVQAGGGGSGGCVATIAGQWAAGRPGAGGGWGRKRITSAFSGVTVTVGAGGTAAAAGDNIGGTGGTSSFGALISCTGGVGGGGSGAAAASGGITGGNISAGGTATGADVSRTGSTAMSPFAVAVATVQMPPGGASFYGPGGAGYVVTSNNAGGATPTSYGGGASGPVNANAGLSAAGGAAGAPGIVIVYEYA